MATKKAPEKAPVEEPKAAEPAVSKPKYDEGDNSIDARMWRLEQDHKRMGSR